MKDEAERPGREAEGVTVAEALAGAERRLAAAGVASPRVDAELLVGTALGTTRTVVYADSGRELSTEESAGLERLVVRREAREPLAYVLGEWGFRRLTLKVDRRVLVPRPETEVPEWSHDVLQVNWKEKASVRARPDGRMFPRPRPA